MNVRPLSEPLQNIAKIELNEIPNQIEENLQLIRNWLSKQEHLKYNRDDQMLVNFLRVCKHSIERTKEKLDAYCTFRSLAPEIAHNLDPFLPVIQTTLQYGLVCSLPIPDEEPAGPAVSIVTFKEYDPNELTAMLIVKIFLMHSEVLFMEKDNYVVSGVIIIVNLKNFQYKTTLQITPTLLQQAIYALQKAVPVRIKALCFINVPKFFESILNIARRFFSKKLTERLHVLSTDNIAELPINIKMSVLPNEYGGDAGPLNDLAATWKKTVESYRDMLLQQNNYHTDESKRPGLSNTAESVFGACGSFRKLEID